MKIAILSAFTVSSEMSIKDLLSDDDPICYKSFHPHPWASILAQSLAKINNNEVHVLTMFGDVKKDRYFEYNNVKYYLIKSTSIPFKAITFFKSNKWKMHKILREIKPDIVHAQGRGREAYFGLISGFPCVVTNHGQNREFYNINCKRNLKCFCDNWKEKRANRLMEYCIGVSPNCTNDSKRFLPEKNVFLIDNPIDPVFFKTNDLSFDNTIMFVGSIIPRKNVLELVKAVHKIKNAELKIISFTKTGNYFDLVADYIKENSLGNRVIILGQKNFMELSTELSKCLAICLPSKYESFGMVLAEAMAVGKPAIGSNIEGIRHVIDDNVNGFLVEPGNVKQIAEKISFLMNNKSVAMKMGQNAKQKALSRWHPDIIAKKTYDVYKKILSNL